MSKNNELSPVMQQYLKMKSENPNSVLMFRLGDFFESFFGDAITISKTLDLVLTNRGTDDRGVEIPMCGIPWHASDNYFARLVKSGINVAIAEQMETPEQAKERGHKQIERRVVRVITAGTLNDESLLTPKKSNYLAAIYEDNIVMVDISTGELLVGQSKNLFDDLIKLSPAEILFDEKFAELSEVKQIRANFNSTPLISRQYDNVSDGDNPAMKMMMFYLKHTQKDSKIKLSAPKKLFGGLQLLIDANSWKSLEIDSSLNAGGISLLDIIDETKTAAGGRMLRGWLHNLTGDINLIENRQKNIENFIKKPAVLKNFQNILGVVPDISRSISRLESGRGMPRDLSSVLDFLNIIPKIKKEGLELSDDMAKKVFEMPDFSEIKNTLDESISENMPSFFRDGNIIKNGFSSELDEVRELSTGAVSAIAALQQEYLGITGVTGLKIKFNGIIGYFIEINEKNSESIKPEMGFIHRQTTGGNLRFTTAALIELDNKIKNAAARANIIEQGLIQNLIDLILKVSDNILNAADIISEIDVFAALAETAENYKWTAPKITKEPAFLISGGRHPVVEKTLKDKAEHFVKNDSDLNNKNIVLLTGPNMSGKSTYLRQNALIAILAHLGSFVPAESATIGIIDQLFSRVGASDNLASGQSTFMVEMSETANILNHATSSSFIIFDEVGRGTATYDGMAIAQSVLEFLDGVKPRTLFATHYHELTDVKLKNAKNMTIKVDESANDIIFLHKVIDGIADKSYGIHVAKMAGMPKSVVTRAGAILETLEKSDDKPLSLF